MTCAKAAATPLTASSCPALTTFVFRSPLSIDDIAKGQRQLLVLSAGKVTLRKMISTRSLLRRSPLVGGYCRNRREGSCCCPSHCLRLSMTFSISLPIITAAQLALGMLIHWAVRLLTPRIREVEVNNLGGVDLRLVLPRLPWRMATCCPTLVLPCYAHC